MMKSKLFLKNSIKSALRFSLFLSIFFYGCQSNIEPTYKENDIPAVVKKICLNEYNLDVTTQRTPTTLWIYAPLEKILHKDFGTDSEKIFDEEISEKLRNILTAIGRVLISCDNTPEFYALVASDINIGLDYTIIGNVLDLKKAYAGFTPWTESNKRYVIKFSTNSEAVKDLTGLHLKAYDITLPDFLANQIAQRINTYFQDVERKKYFKVEKSEGEFNNGNFIFSYSINQTSNSPQRIDIVKEILKIISYCLKTYEFKAFSSVEINGASGQDKFTLSKEAILAIPED